MLRGCVGRVCWEGVLGECDGRVMGGEGGWEGDGKVRVLNVPLTISCSKDVVQKNKHVAGHVECKVVAEKDTNIHLQYSLVISLTPGTTMTT